MHLYRCDLLLHDYLFFATTERGKVAETGRFIHNYALTYALGWAKSRWRNETQQPHYPEELAAAWRSMQAYVTPATLLDGNFIVNQYNTMPETYGLGKSQSIGYPDWGFAKCIRPLARFRFYVVSREIIKDFPPYIRLGKFMAKAQLRVEHARQITQKPSGNCQSQLLLAWDDLSAKPTMFDLIANALPTRLIYNAHFDDTPHLVAEFRDDSIELPLNIGYLSQANKKAFPCDKCQKDLDSLREALCNSL